MSKSINDIPKAHRSCPFCKTEGKVVRVLKYGATQNLEQIKIECPDCHHSWLYHTDE
ncbi:MAG: hypothetical protein ABIH23_22080 [bacterium]